MSKCLSVLILLVGVIGLSGAVEAQERQSDAAPPTVHVQSLDPTLDVRELKSGGVQTHEAGELAAPEVWSPPAPELRDRWLKEAGLGAETAAWDAMDRDLLVLKARNHPLERLIQSYPKLAATKLKKLRGLVLK